MKIFSNKSHILLILIILFASFFRLYGLNWDQGQHLHPDERFLTMVVSAMKIPNSFGDYLNPKISTMNPYNLNFSFFVYGTFPLFLTRIIGELINKSDYWNVHFVGRILSSIFDIGTVFFLFIIGKKIINEKIGLLSAFLYSIMVLPIQLSHFFAVDPFLNFFLVLSFYLLTLLLTTYYLLPISLLLGLSFGFALACKISALYFLPIIGIGYLFLLLKNLRSPKFLKLLFSGVLFIFVSVLTFRINQPSAFSTGDFTNWELNPQLINNLKELQSFNQPDTWFPPAVQWKKTTPEVFPLKNLVVWGMGLPLGVISIIAVCYSLISLILLVNKRPKKLPIVNLINSLILLFVFGLFLYLGLQFCKTMRYFLPIYPFLALLSANFLVQKVFLKMNIKFIIFIIIIIFIYPISFLSIYSHPTTRVSASEWIYQNVASDSTIANELWDDPLPLNLPDKTSSIYPGEMLALYDDDTPEKWQKINDQLKKTDIIVLSSNRLYGSIPQNPEHYPLTTKYYQSLFDGTLGFKKVAEFNSYPCFPPIGKHLFCLNDDSAEEAFTVYDHPKVLIFKKGI